MMSLIYQVCKRIIQRGNYADDIKARLDAFVKANVISKEEYEELIAMLG